jgi:isoprenylcysteine carboxyl methyltransferase (ICMT) family protein YpbQ
MTIVVLTARILARRPVKVAVLARAAKIARIAWAVLVSGKPTRRRPRLTLKRPNYLVIIAEIAVLPLVFGAWQIALLFSALNALLLSHRIRVE